MGQYKPQKPIIVGPVVNQTQAQAHLANPIEKTHSEAVINSYLNGLNERMFCVQGMSGSGETAREPGAVAKSLMVVPAAPMRAKLHSCLVTKLLAPILVLEVVYADGMKLREYELLFLPWGKSGVDTKYFGNREKNSGPLECVPLPCWVPRVAKDMVLNIVAEEGELDVTKVEHSKWVSTMMNSFCKMVGFPIIKHETQCVALFCLLEQECLEVANDSCNR